MKKPLIWGHRGASGYAPENTLPAFQKAIELGADGVELDIQLTKDRELVVCHDETVDRTSNGAGWIRDLTLAELKKLNFCASYPELGKVEIPTMREVLEVIQPSALTIDIELKTGIVDYQGIEEKILALVHEFGMENRVMYSSFNHYSMVRIKSLDPSVKTGILYEDGPVGITPYAKKLKASALHPALYNLRFDHFMEDAAAEGLEVNVWTVNEPEHMALCTKMGVNAIITNYPDTARKVSQETE